MNKEMYTCPLCGNRFDPQEHVACGSCPMHTGCSMVCCPHCGYSTVDEGQSKVVKWITTILGKDAIDEKT